ncbi:MAG TPA: DUF445 domain-containing protein [Nitrospinaceae bacterium]|nr:DUF445 domain-containing protein [Nitrospinaceae bacterium]
MASKYPHFLHKNVLTNAIAATIAALGIVMPQPILLSVGLFALSGAITNWLAIHMLFEKVPGLYGSGVIPSRFEDFKQGIHNLIMEQFFTKENFERFYQSTSTEGEGPHFDFGGVINKTDLSPSFEALVSIILESKFGAMLGMFGGVEALTPLKGPFIDKMKSSLNDISKSEDFQKTVHDMLSSSTAQGDLHDKVTNVVRMRLDELTPQLVKEIIQEMIRDHLGWLVVWGGIFGGIIGLIAGFIDV